MRQAAVILRRTDGTEGMLLTSERPLDATLQGAEQSANDGYLYHEDRYAIAAPRVPRREVVAASGGLVALLIVLGIASACVGLWAWRTFA